MVQENDRVTRSEAILAKCHECCGYYFDDKDDCGVNACPLYSWMPYKKATPDLEWAKYNHRLKGQVLKEDSTRTITDEQRLAMSERLKLAREKRSSNANDD
jgi:hypothetical protein